MYFIGEQCARANSADDQKELLTPRLWYHLWRGVFDLSICKLGMLE